MALERRAPLTDEGGALRRDQDPADRAREICLRLLESGPRTHRELAIALANKGIPEDVADQVLERFIDVGLVDDALFARLWVDSRHRSRGLSGRALQQELRRKGIEDTVAREAVQGLDPGDEVATARALVGRKLGGTRGLAADARVRRLAGMLARKGYSPALAYRVVREALEAEGFDAPVLDTDGLSALD